MCVRENERERELEEREWLARENHQIKLLSEEGKQLETKTCSNIERVREVVVRLRDREREREAERERDRERERASIIEEERSRTAVKHKSLIFAESRGATTNNQTRAEVKKFLSQLKAIIFSAIFVECELEQYRRKVKTNVDSSKETCSNSDSSSSSSATC